ncbi:unnamed protein product [Miscanthus lutarioriparius]|uniref:Uncharacterized protein n=1 Tax=Miscanthus lutarioriparius TaxID=422564 RepID=A0A811NQD5_9POAL|nr:unnamed protein product [Miscanthus lutarioriparius]
MSRTKPKMNKSNCTLGSLTAGTAGFIEKSTNADIYWTKTLPGLLFGREVCLDVLHLPVADPEGLGEDVGGHGRRGAEERHGDLLRALELAVEGGDDGGGAVPPVLLEVDEAAREDEDVPHGDRLGEELVGGGDEADLERALEDEDDLGGARGSRLNQRSLPSIPLLQSSEKKNWGEHRDTSLVFPGFQAELEESDLIIAIKSKQTDGAPVVPTATGLLTKLTSGQRYENATYFILRLILIKCGSLLLATYPRKLLLPSSYSSSSMFRLRLFFCKEIG